MVINNEILYEKKMGVPRFECTEYCNKMKEYALLIPIINEGERIIKELRRACYYHVTDYADIIICDGGSTDGCTRESVLRKLGVNSLLVKRDVGKQGAQLRMGFWWALQRGYKGIITVDGNNKDSIEDVPRFIDKLVKGYDFVQGSRFMKGGKGINTPWIRNISVRVIHAPIISMTAHYKFTDTTNAFRGYSSKYLQDKRVQPFREIFMSYELLAYLSVRASQIGLRVCEIPVTRRYPKRKKTPTKISLFKGNGELLTILLKNAVGVYNPNLESA